MSYDFGKSKIPILVCNNYYLFFFLFTEDHFEWKKIEEIRRCLDDFYNTYMPSIGLTQVYMCIANRSCSFYFNGANQPRGIG